MIREHEELNHSHIWSIKKNPWFNPSIKAMLPPYGQPSAIPLSPLSTPGSCSCFKVRWPKIYVLSHEQGWQCWLIHDSKRISCLIHVNSDFGFFHSWCPQGWFNTTHNSQDMESVCLIPGSNGFLLKEDTTSSVAWGARGLLTHSMLLGGFEAGWSC